MNEYEVFARRSVPRAGWLVELGPEDATRRTDDVGLHILGKRRGRTFNILLDETIVAAQISQYDHQGELFSVEYPVPPELTRGKENVTVKFLPHEGSMAGNIFGCVMPE